MKKKKNKINWIEAVYMVRILLFLCIFIGTICGLVYNAMLFMGMYHNIDLTHNILIVANDLNRDFNENNITDYYDKSYLFNYRYVSDEYNVGESKPLSNFYQESMDNIVNEFLRAMEFAAYAAFVFLILLFDIYRYADYKGKQQ